MIILKRIGLCFFILLLLILSSIWIADNQINNRTASYVFSRWQDVPQQKVGLVLGTSKNGRFGVNLYFHYRIQAATELYKAGKIKYIVVSGDNSRSSYNEPKDMKDELVKNGIPEDVIYLDYAGFRTLDSIVRLNKIFGQEEFVVISQQFHNQRAIYIAQQYGLKAYGYNAQDVNTRAGLKTNVREKFARVKVFVDILTGKNPKFLGEEIHIP